MTVVNDLERGRVLYVAEDRKQESLDGFWGTLTEAQSERHRGGGHGHVGPVCGRRCASMCRKPTSKIVFDKFHVAQHLGEAVDEVRRKENKALRAAGDDRLKGTRYDWLRNPATMDPEDRRAFAALRNSELKTARAWALKETAMNLYAYVYEGPARKHFQWWYGWAVRSRLRR